MSTVDQIMALTRMLYPTGRAFKLRVGSIFHKLHYALAKSEAKAYDDARSILNSTLPDNSEFSADDATQWEKRLGLISNSNVSLANRKLAIQRKLNHPGTIPARQNFRYLEGQLRAAGFDVYVYENRFSDGLGGFTTKTPAEVSGEGSAAIQHGDAQHGDFQMGGTSSNMVVNHLYLENDVNFNTAGNLRSSFFIGGSPIGSSADVDANRQAEFRQLILKIKPAHTIGFLFINYI